MNAEDRALVVVLSSLRPTLEETLIARGVRVLAIVPSSVAESARGQGYEVREVEHWDDYTALAALAYELELLGVARIETCDERCLRAAAFIRSCLGLEGQGFREAVTSTDKALMKRRLRRAGIPVADHVVAHGLDEVKEIADEMGWPVVVKPRFGFSAINTLKVVSRDHLDDLILTGSLLGQPNSSGLLALQASPGLGPLGADGFGFVVERFIDVKDEYHCELLRAEGQELYCLPFRYPSPLLEHADDKVGSSHVVLGTSSADAVQALTRRAATALGIEHGFAHCEVFQAWDGEWLIGEIGARPGGSQVPRIMRYQYGIDVHSLVADLSLGRIPEVSMSVDDRSFAWLSVPAPNGRITKMTTPEEAYAMPGLVEVVMEMSVGDVATGAVGSLAYAAFVFCAAANPQEAVALAYAASDSFVIETEDTASVALGSSIS